MLDRTLYYAWRDMKRRCYIPDFKQYQDYGGRGIKVCARWQDFDNFKKDMGEQPDKGYQLDRINNDGDYEPSNCRWATTAEQASNRRSNRLVTVFGRTQNIKQWADEFGIKARTVRARLDYGWSPEAVFTKPIRPIMKGRQ